MMMTLLFYIEKVGNSSCITVESKYPSLNCGNPGLLRGKTTHQPVRVCVIIYSKCVCVCHCASARLASPGEKANSLNSICEAGLQLELPFTARTRTHTRLL